MTSFPISVTAQLNSSKYNYGVFWAFCNVFLHYHIFVLNTNEDSFQYVDNLFPTFIDTICLSLFEFEFIFLLYNNIET